jgi:hypothetical protein
MADVHHLQHVILLSSRYLNIYCLLGPDVVRSGSTLKMKAADFSETSVTTYQTTRNHIPDVSNLHGKNLNFVVARKPNKM